jgi:dynein intermediate chain, cytosolic
MVTASTDGRVNFWSLSNLRDPAESILVGDSVSCFAVAPESETILLGDEYGRMFTVQSSSQTGGQRSSRRQAKKIATSDEKSGEDFGHYGMITSLSTKLLKKGASTRAAGLYKGFLRGSGGLVLSSGVDWTVKLWAPAYSDKPLTSLVSHSYDYMSNVMWSPTHPSLFATASSNGTVGLWNLATSFEEPMTGQDGIVVEPDAMSGRGLNKLKWSLDGRRIAVAASDRLHILSFTEEVTRSKGDEDSKIMNQLLARGLIERQ